MRVLCGLVILLIIIVLLLYKILSLKSIIYHKNQFLYAVKAKISLQIKERCFEHIWPTNWGNRPLAPKLTPIST